MKKLYLVSILVLMLSMLFFPLAAKGDKTEEPKLPAMGDPFLEEEFAEKKTFKILRSESGQIEEMSVEDYLFSVVAAEMPALYEVEALKAQTVAAYTYALRKAESENKEYDLSDDSAIDQAFTPREKVREKWGENADEYEKKLREAIKSVLYERITYNGKPILAAYHAISSGKTEKAVDIWGGDYPYLVAIDSVGDKLSPNYLSTATFTEAELKEKMSQIVTLSGEAAAWFSDMGKSESGSVLTAVVGGKAVSGGEIRKALGLRSSNFDVVYKDGSFTFTVRGYGHGIGMSQYGADYLAGQGKNYKEILLHYYPGCVIE